MEQVVGAQPVVAEGNAILGSLTPSTDCWWKPYGAIQGAKTARMMKSAVISSPVASSQRATPVVFRNGAVMVLNDQYLTRGSMTALTMSTTRLTTTTTMAKNVTRPCTAA